MLTRHEGSDNRKLSAEAPNLSVVRLPAGVFDEDVILQALVVGRVPGVDQDAGVHDRHPLPPVAVQLVQERLWSQRPTMFG